MAETLTESFCERCGTRYEFQAPTRLNPLRRTRGFIGGLRNYLTSQDDLADAMGDAMRSEEDNLAAAQLEAFHESFNFCIDCRQYTCLNCWNNDAGRCRSCAPIPGTDDLAERLAAASAVATPLVAEPELVYEDATLVRPGLDAWPASDLPTEAALASSGQAEAPWPAVETLQTEPEPEPVVAEFEVEPLPEPITAWQPAPTTEPEAEPQPVAAELDSALAEIEVEPEPVLVELDAEPEPMPVLVELDAEPTPEPAAEAETEPEPARPALRVVAWDEDSAYQLIEPEPMVELVPEPAAAEVERSFEPVDAEAEPQPVAAEVEPEPVAAEVEAEPEPVAAEIEAEPQPVAAETEPTPEPEPVAAEVESEPKAEPVRPAPRMAPISDTILHFPARRTPEQAPAEGDRAAAAADSPELAARRAQLDLLGLGDPGQGPVAPERPQELPYRSRGAAASHGELTRQAALQGSFWEASAREVANATGHVGVQNCGQCGLSLSANARFCRRCGTRQAQSA
ncbi:MAG: hypothetical protein M3153_12410 [Chloroflexota bacterium]|nr:hypothetical protein [Chloroflexota bacterium]